MQKDITMLKVGAGGFRVTPKPRGGEWLEDELRKFRDQGFSVVASLLTEEENSELGLTQEAVSCGQLGIEFHSFPITDRSVPSDRRSFLELSKALHSHLAPGNFGILHCRAGLGRAPLLGCAILREEGLDAEDAWSRIASARGQAVPDTPEQKRWLSEGHSCSGNLDELFSKLQAGTIE